MTEAFTDPARGAKLSKALEGLDALVAERGKSLGVPGLFVGVVVDGELVKSASFGVRDVETRAPIDADTIFRIGSITKAFTVTALLKLRDDGRLSFDVPAATYLPEFARVRYPSKDSPPITLRHLMTHSSGLPRDGGYDSLAKTTDISEANVLGALDGVALESAPGSRYRYSNFGFSLLGLVIARVSGMPYRKFMASALLEPLGLASAGWEPKELAADRLAVSYSRDKSGKLVADRSYARLGASEADGGLYLSGRDFARFLAWQLAAYPPRDDADPGSVRRSSLREAHTPARSFDLSVEAAPAKSRWIANATSSAIGLGWHVFSNCDLDQVVWHNGLVDHYKSDAVFLPRRGVGVFTFANGNTSLSRLRADVLDLLLASGAFVPRERVATRAPRLDAALRALLAVQNSWSEPAYAAMLSAGHRERVDPAVERSELDRYRGLHGACSPGPIVEYFDPAHARYRLSCERGQLEMELQLEAETGLISGFTGHSRDVAEAPGSSAAAARAVALLNRWPEGTRSGLFAPDFMSETRARAAFAKQRAELGRCKLGPALERFGLDHQRFRLECQKASNLALSIHLDSHTPPRVDRLEIRPETSTACAQRAP